MRSEGMLSAAIQHGSSDPYGYGVSAYSAEWSGNGRLHVHCWIRGGTRPWHHSLFDLGLPVIVH